MMQNDRGVESCALTASDDNKIKPIPVIAFPSTLKGTFIVCFIYPNLLLLKSICINLMLARVGNIIFQMELPYDY